MMDPITELDAKILDFILSQDHSLDYIGDSVLDEKFFDENKSYINYLDSSGYIRKHGDHVYSIKSKGKLFINGGGFTRAWREKEEQAQLLKKQSILLNEKIKHNKYKKLGSTILAIAAFLAAIFTILQYFKN